MRQYSQSGDQPSGRRLMRRLDRALGELNVFLAALAIGLAVLDLTCLYGLTVGRQMIEAVEHGPTSDYGFPGLVSETQRPSQDSSP